MQLETSYWKMCHPGYNWLCTPPLALNTTTLVLPYCLSPSQNPEMSAELSKYSFGTTLFQHFIIVLNERLRQWMFRSKENFYFCLIISCCRGYISIWRMFQLESGIKEGLVRFVHCCSRCLCCLTCVTKAICLAVRLEPKGTFSRGRNVFGEPVTVDLTCGATIGKGRP